MVEDLADLGGLFFLLSFLHFVVDWGFQSHREAVTKAINHKVRAIHCTVYTLGMAPLVWLGSTQPAHIVISLFTLWGSHFLIDTYVPVYLWARHLRKAPVFERTKPSGAIDLFSKRQKEDTNLDKFRAFASTPIGLFLMIAMDQAFHLLFLLPVAALMIWPTYDWMCYISIGWLLTMLLAMVVSGASTLKNYQ